MHWIRDTRATVCRLLTIVLPALLIINIVQAEDRDQILSRILNQYQNYDVVLAPENANFDFQSQKFGHSGGEMVKIKSPQKNYGITTKVTTHKRMKNEWDAQISLSLAKSVQKHDVLLAVFRARNPQGTDGREAQTSLIIEKNSHPYEKSASYPVRIEADWKLYYVPFKMQNSYKANEWSLIFRAGYNSQIFEITDVRLYNFGQNVELEDLPRISAEYDGIQPDAVWRKEADARINKIRKSNLNIVVKDTHGKPISHATVKIQMKRHAFLFGSAVKLHWIADSQNPEMQIYRNKILELFNHVVNENDLKWAPWEGLAGNTFSKEKAEQGLYWLKKNNFHIKGHCIIWPSWKHTIPAVQANASKPTVMKQIIDNHIEDLVPVVGNYIDEWDVINEPFNNHDVMDVLGQDEMTNWFKLARKYDPDARLYLNDWGILAAGGSTDTEHQQHYEDTIAHLIRQGAPIGGIGMQSHFGSDVTPPTKLWMILDRFAKFDLPIQITEYDITTNDKELMANYTRDFMTAIFAHKAVNGFVMWGFWSEGHWRPSAAIFDKDWNILEHGKVYKDLVFNKWWTNGTLKTDENGQVNTRGFLGTYDITVNYENKTINKSIELNKAGQKILVTID